MTQFRQSLSPQDSADEQFRQLADLMPQLAWMTRPDGWVYWYNQRWYEFTGTKPDDVLGWGWQRLHHPDYLQKVLDRWQRSLASGEPFDMEFPIRGAGGDFRMVLTLAMPLRERDGTVIRWFGTCTDVTAREDAARQIAVLNRDLHHRVQELETLFDALPVGVCIAKDTACTVITANSAASRMLGLTNGRNVSKTGPEGGALPFRVEKNGQELKGEDLPMQTCVRTGKPVIGERLEIVRGDGSVSKLHEYAIPLRDENNTIRGCVGVFVDLTSELAAEDAKRESEQRFRVLADSAPVLIWMSDPSKRCLWFNKAWLDFVRRRMEEELGNGWTENVHPDDFDRCIATYVRNFDARSEFEMSYRLRRRDGTYRWMLDHGIPLVTPDGVFNGYVGSCVDITELEEAKMFLQDQAQMLERQVAERTLELRDSHEKLRLSERLASLGTLAAGIGHDLGNLLFPIRVHLDEMERRGGSEVKEDLDAIRMSVGYLSKLSKGLRLLAMNPNADHPDAGRTQVGEWWADVERFLRTPLPRGVEFKADIADVCVAMSPAALTQVMFNLLQNAADAMRASGQGTSIAISSEVRGSHLAISVTDNGPGMPPDVRARCLDPFFTTRTKEVSTGLGLLLVRGSVQRVGGDIEIDTEPGKGTTFRITLPIVQDPAGGAASASESAHLAVTNPRLRAYLSALLSSLSVKVSSSPTPEDATLWVVESAKAGPVEEYLAANPRRVVVCFGAEAPMKESERLIILPNELKPQVIQPRVRAAVATIYQAGVGGQAKG